MTVLHYFLALLLGALAVSFAEYRLNYNLIDWIVEKVQGLFNKAFAKVEAKAKAVEKKL